MNHISEELQAQLLPELHAEMMRQETIKQLVRTTRICILSFSLECQLPEELEAVATQFENAAANFRQHAAKLRSL